MCFCDEIIIKNVHKRGLDFDCRKYYYFYQSCPSSKTFSEDNFRAAGTAGDRRTLVNVASVSVSLINRWINKMSQMLSICYSFPTCSKTKNVHLELKLTSPLGLSFIDRKQSKITKPLKLSQRYEQTENALNISLLKPSPGYCSKQNFSAIQISSEQWQ